MTILITGISGFIGSHLLRRACATYGHDHVIALSSRSTELCHSIKYDESALRLKGPDIEALARVEVLIHVGAFIPKNSTNGNDIKACNGNISFTERLLCAPFVKLKKLIYISTVDVYEVTEPITESTPVRPATLYGWSKLYCERLIECDGIKNGYRTQILRLGHVYGPGEDRFEKFLPGAMRSIVNNQPVTLWGGGDEIRSLIYIDDVVSAILRSVNLHEDIGPINVVGGVPITIRELLSRVITVSGKNPIIIQRQVSGKKKNYIFDNRKMREYLLDTETDLLLGIRNEYEYMLARS